MTYEEEEGEPDDETEDEEEAHADEELDPEGLGVARLAPAALAVGVAALDLEQVGVEVLDLEPLEEVQGRPVDGPVQDRRQLVPERNRAIGHDCMPKVRYLNINI
jgi:hypothetical protein